MAVGCVLATGALAAGTVEMQRLYNPNSGEHFYTASAVERDHLVSVGWNDEGVAWYGVAPGAATGTAPAEPEAPSPDDAQNPSTPTAPSQGGQQGGETRPPAADPEPEAPAIDPTPAACDHQWEDVYRTESYVVSEAYDYQKQVYVRDQWQCQCLELFDSSDDLFEHQNYHYDNGTINGHGRSRVVPVYEYETVHVPAVMGERQILLYTECTKCGSRF